MTSKTQSNVIDKKEFDRLISEAESESDLLEVEIENLSESAKAFAERHGSNRNDQK